MRALLIAVFAVGIILRVAFLGGVEYWKTADEGYYGSYAFYLAKAPDASLPALTQKYLAYRQAQVYPSPLRAAYHILASWSMRISKNFTFRALADVSALFGILTLFVGYFFAKRLFGDKTAVLVLILLASSSLGLGFARRALPETAVSFTILLSVYAFYLMLKNKGRRYKALFAASFILAIMIKESSVLLAPFFLLYMFWEKIAVNKGLEIAGPLTSLAAVPLVSFFLYIVIAGSLSNFIAVTKIILFSSGTNLYAIKQQSGTILRYLFDFFLVSPVTLTAAVVFLIYYAAKKDTRSEPATYLAAFFAIFYLTYSFFSKNLRIVMVLDFPVRVFAVLLVSGLCARFKSRQWAASLGVVSVIAVIDLLIFRQLFLIQKLYDPVTDHIIKAWRSEYLPMIQAAGVILERI